MLHRLMFAVYLVAAAGISAPTAQAQAFGRVDNVQASGTSYHVFTQPGQATVRVLVMGLGGGIYEVGAGTRLDELVALVGGGAGVQLGQRPRDVQRYATVRLYRDQGERRSLVYEASLEDMLLNPGEHPELGDGDVFSIEVVDRNRFSWRDGLSVLTSVSTLVLVADRLIRRF